MEKFSPVAVSSCFRSAPRTCGAKRRMKFHRVVAQVRAALVREPRRLRREEVAAVEGPQPLVLSLAEGARRDDPDAEAQGHVRLDDVGVERGERDLGLEPARGESLVDRRAPAKVAVVGDERMARDRSSVSGFTRASG
jgi:hypothetical protein